MKNPDDYIAELLKRVKAEYIVKTYGVAQWIDHTDFLSQLAVKSGKLLKVLPPCLSFFSIQMANVRTLIGRRGRYPHCGQDGP